LEIESAGDPLPDGSANVFSNCVDDFNDYSVFIRICGGFTPTPTLSPTPRPTLLPTLTPTSPTLSPTTLSPTLKPTAHWHDVFECAEGDVNIESPTFKSIKVSKILDEAVIECQGACQASVDCQYWSLNREKHLCELKKNDTGKVPSEDHISGERLCDYCGNNKTEDLFCNTKGCEASLNVTGVCSQEFSIQILHGDFGNHSDETVYMYVNEEYIGECDPGFDLDKLAYGTPPGWYSCGSYSSPTDGKVNLRLKAGSGVDTNSRNVYNGQQYALYGRLFFSTGGDYFAVAPRCPAVKGLKECANSACGEYCLAGTSSVKLDFGQPGIYVQEGFIKLGMPDGGNYNNGKYSSTFEYAGRTVTIKIRGFTHTRGRGLEVVNSYARLSNLLRSSFLVYRRTMNVEINGLVKSAMYRIKTYHH
jgi:hypothetical protein